MPPTLKLNLTPALTGEQFSSGEIVRIPFENNIGVYIPPANVGSWKYDFTVLKWSTANQMFPQKYQEPVNDFYAETKNEEILGSVLVSCPSLNQNELHSFQEKRKELQSKKQPHVGSWY